MRQVVASMICLCRLIQVMAGTFRAVSLFTVTMSAVVLTSETRADVPGTISSFVGTHCLDCHTADEAEAGLDLAALSFALEDRSVHRKWVEVFDRIRSGEMPPPDAEQPSPTDRENFLKSLSAPLALSDRRRQQRAGRTVLRRLNPVEYEYTVRDLLAAPWLEIRDMLPPEREMYGFDNVAEAQDFSYVQMARYLEAAEVAIDGAMLLGPEQEPTTVKTGFSEVPRFINRGGWAIMLRQPNSAQAPWRIDNKRQREAGWYRFKVHCKSVWYEDQQVLRGRSNQVAAINTAAKRFLHTFDVYPEPRLVEFTAWMNRDELLEFYCASLSDQTAPRDKDKQEGKEEKMRGFKGDGVAVASIEIEGPFAGPSCNAAVESWPPESYRRLFGDLSTQPWTKESGLLEPELLHLPDLTANKRPREPLQRPIGLTMVVSADPLGDAERLLRTFMDRAYRGEVPEGEFERCFAFARAAVDRKACFQDVMRVACKAVLTSPDFLYFREPSGKLTSAALATRLAYFLWRSAPDRELLQADLADPFVMRKTVNAMLDDPRSSRWVSDFCGQWLDLRELYDTSPDRLLFPEYWGDMHLVQSARCETEAMFAAMIEHDLPASSVVNADFVMINERLADLYGIANVAGVEMRRVSLPPGSPRGGFLTQASILKVTANGLTTSPVIRGAWVLDRLLGTPPAAPPPNVGSIEPDTRGATTVREQLAKHREVASCASCHATIDPPGFALESFDVMGGWRDRYRTTGPDGEKINRRFASKEVSYRVGPKVDASGKTPDGEAFTDYREFREYLAGQQEQIARNLVRRLLTFATGAGISFADRQAVETILHKTKSCGYGLRSILVEIVLSPTFQNK